MDGLEFNNSMGDSRIGPRINPTDYPSLVCDKCGSRLFTAVAAFKKVSGLVLGDGVDDVPMPVFKTFVCAKCGEIMELDRSIWNEVEEKLKSEDEALENNKPAASGIII